MSSCTQLARLMAQRQSARHVKAGEGELTKAIELAAGCCGLNVSAPPSSLQSYRQGPVTGPAPSRHFALRVAPLAHCPSQSQGADSFPAGVLRARAHSARCPRCARLSAALSFACGCCVWCSLAAAAPCCLLLLCGRILASVVCWTGLVDHLVLVCFPPKMSRTSKW